MLTRAWNWIKSQVDKFETWVANKLPGWKTKIVALAGTVGSAALLAQDYVSGLPMEQLVGAKTLAYINIGLFTLVFWFRRLTNKEA